MKINAKNLGLAFGLTWGLYVAAITLIAKTGFAAGFVHALGTLYIGDKPGLIGAILGLIYGFIDGFIAGWLVAYFYNLFNKEN